MSHSATQAKRLPVPLVRTTLTVGAFITSDDGLGVEAVAGVDLAGDQRLRARRGVGDVAQLDAVEIAAARLPVVALLALGEHAHAGLETVRASNAPVPSGLEKSVKLLGTIRM